MGAGRGLHKGVEDPPQVSRRYARSGVFHIHQQVPRIGGALATQPPDHLAAFGELDGVAEQVGEDLAQLVPVTQHHEGDVLGHLHPKQQALGVGTQTEDGGQVRNQVAKIEDRDAQLGVASLDLGHVQDIVDDRQQVLAAAHDGVQVLPLRGTQRPILE